MTRVSRLLSVPLALALVAALICPTALAQDTEDVRPPEAAEAEDAEPVDAPEPADAESAEAPDEAEDADEEPTVNNSFFDTDLRQALADVAMETGVTLLVDESVSGFVTLDLEDVPLSRALKLMLEPGGFVWKETEPDLYVITAPDPDSRSFPLISETELLSLRYATPDAIVPLLPERLQMFVTPDEAGRRLIVEAPEQLMPQILERIDLLDTRPGQVMIEAMVIETTAGALRDFDPELATSHFGVSASGGIVRYESIPRQADDPMNGVAPEEGNLVLGLRWLLENNQAELRACPRIIALDGEEAKIEVGTEQYFSILTGSAAYAYTRLEKIDATISLDILPRIIAETGEVHCVINPNVSDVAGTGEGGLPVITVRRAESTVRLQNGEAVAIGGLIEEKSTKRKSRVPILSEIPLVGDLFKSTRKTHEQREIVILIAPHILDDNGQIEGPLLGDALLGEEVAEEAQ